MRFVDRSLFRKIFLHFWLAIGLALVISTIGSHLVGLVLSSPRVNDSKSTSVLHEKARAAAAIAGKAGARELAEYARHTDLETGGRTWVIDEGGIAGRDVLGESVPAGVSTLARKAGLSGKEESTLADRIAAEKVQDKDGHSWLIAVSEEQARKEGEQSLAVRILLEVGAITLGALLLARYITSPILILRVAAAQIESGDLSARVMGKLGQRWDELGDLGHSFDRMAARIETLVGAQRDLIGEVSHELRSPLARLTVAAGLARRHALPEEACHLDRIESEAERLNSLLGQLLTLSRLESASEFAYAWLDLSSLVQEVAADGDFEARSRGCSVVVAACSPCRVRGSVEQLRSAVENVVRNAVRYTAAGSVVRITLECRTAKGSPVAVLSVSDHGPGVPEEFLARIFEPFYRVASDYGERDSGTGLGLAITSRVIRLHDGTIRASNVPGAGLTVEIRLPSEIGLQ